MRSLRAIFLVAALIQSSVLAGQSRGDRSIDTERERARIQNNLGWEYLRKEQWAQAVQSFRRAIEIDPTYEYAYYGLGRAELGRRELTAAIAALEKCSALYRAESGRQFTNAQEAQRYRRDRILEID